MSVHPVSIIIIVILLPLFRGWYAEMAVGLFKDAMNKDASFFDRYLAFIMFCLSLALPIATIAATLIFGAMISQQMQK